MTRVALGELDLASQRIEVLCDIDAIAV